MMQNKVDALIEKIEQQKQSGDYKQALKIALKGLNEDMNDYRIYEELADIYIFEDNLDKAEEVIGYARELHPESGTGMYLEGYILSEKGDYKKAIEVLKKANQLFPNNAEVLRNIGWCYIMINSFQRGIALLQRAKQLAPQDEKISHNLASALLFYSEKKSSTSLS